VREGTFTILYMIAVTGVFTAAVSGVNGLTMERVELNRKFHERRHVLGALDLTEDPDLDPMEVKRLFQERVSETGWPGREKPLYVRLDADGRPEGYAFPIEGPGFWGPIHGFLGVAADPASEHAGEGDALELLGIAFVSHSETPGLGARIQNKEFTEQFEEMTLTPPKEEGARWIELQKEGAALGPNEVHAITGATRTSDAVETFLNGSFHEILKALRSLRAEETAREKEGD